jgi:hypothetical protein
LLLAATVDHVRTDLMFSLSPSLLQDHIIAAINFGHQLFGHVTHTYTLSTLVFTYVLHMVSETDHIRSSMSNVVKTGWGFHVSTEILARAALIWQHLRTFRLIRARQLSDLGRGDTGNLASLPQEIIDIIEGELAMHAFHLVTVKELVDFPCYDCPEMAHEFYNSPEFAHSFEPFRDSFVHNQLNILQQSGEEWDSEDSDLLDDLSQQAFDIFRGTVENSELFHAYLPGHQRGCKIYFGKSDRFWGELSACLISDHCNIGNEWVRSRRD